jgi:hypothetical protein
MFRQVCRRLAALGVVGALLLGASGCEDPMKGKIIIDTFDPQTYELANEYPSLWMLLMSIPPLG